MWRPFFYTKMMNMNQSYHIGFAILLSFRFYISELMELAFPIVTLRISVDLAFEVGVDMIWQTNYNRS